jgi:hypothetical protein
LGTSIISCLESWNSSAKIISITSLAEKSIQLL